MTMQHMSRGSWTTAPYPDGATMLDGDEVDGVAVHWNGPPVSAAAARGELTAVKALLEADRRFHVSTRGWSDIAYNFAVDNAGRIWDLRGISRRSAANGDTGPNRRYVAVLAVIGQGQKPTEAMLDGIRSAVALVRARYPHAIAVKTHNDVRPEPTACPGPDLTAATHGGQLTPRSVQRQDDPGRDERKLPHEQRWLRGAAGRISVGDSGDAAAAVNRYLGYGGTTLTAKTIEGAVKALRLHGYDGTAARVASQDSIGRGAYGALAALSRAGKHPYS